MFSYGLSLIISFSYHGYIYTYIYKCFVDLSWMYAVVFLDLSWMCAVVFLALSWMFALAFPSSVMNVCHILSLIYDGFVP